MSSPSSPSDRAQGALRARNDRRRRSQCAPILLLETLGEFVASRFVEVPVDVHCDHDRAVTEVLLDRLRVSIGSDEEGSAWIGSESYANWRERHETVTHETTEKRSISHVKAPQRFRAAGMSESADPPPEQDRQGCWFTICSLVIVAAV